MTSCEVVAVAILFLLLFDLAEGAVDTILLLWSRFQRLLLLPQLVRACPRLIGIGIVVHDLRLCLLGCFIADLERHVSRARLDLSLALLISGLVDQPLEPRLLVLGVYARSGSALAPCGHGHELLCVVQVASFERAREAVGSYCVLKGLLPCGNLRSLDL